jgi:hypothetical protein
VGWQAAFAGMFLEICNHDHGAFVREPLSDRSTDPRRGTGHNRYALL